MMLKKADPLEDTVVTQPETPPLELPTQQTSSTQLIHRIIASNEELIHQQMMAMRHLQTNNAHLEDRLKVATRRYDALYELAFNGRQKQAEKSTSNSAQTGTQMHQKQAKMVNKVTVQGLLAKVADLEQQLSTTKVQLAVKSAELLTAAFHQKHEESAQRRRKTIIPESSKADIERYFEPHTLFREEENKIKLTPQNREVIEAWTKLLEQYGSQQKSVRFKEKASVLMKKPIPRQLRGRCWPLFIENRLGMTNSLYIQLLQRRDKGWVCEKVKGQIEKDIRRSFYGKTNYETKTGFILQVVEFLEIFHVFRPDVSYVQGMTYPALVLIPVLGKIRAFTLFCNLVLGNSFLRRLFSMEGTFVASICRGFEAMLEDCLPSVAQQMSGMGIQSEIYLIQWLFTFFSRGLSLQATLKFWDQLLYHEEVAIFRMALSIFQQLTPVLSGMNYEQTVGCVREYAGNVKEEKVIQGLMASKLTSEKLYKALERVKV